MNSFTCRYKKWLPDNVEKRHDTKTTYQVEIRYANNTNETFTFHGPPGNEEAILMSKLVFIFHDFITQVPMNILALWNGLDHISIVADQIDGS